MRIAEALHDTTPNTSDSSTMPQDAMVVVAVHKKQGPFANVLSAVTVQVGKGPLAGRRTVFYVVGWPFV
jgi:hypothetical protein